MGTLSRMDLPAAINALGCRVLFETGTGRGDGLAYAVRLPFRRLVSSELVPELAREAAARFAGDPRVEVLTGSSIAVLSDQLARIPQTEPVLFWLDAHFPGADFALASYDAERDDTVRLPLERELELIAHQRPHARDVILVDDLRIYCDGPFEHGNLPAFAQTLPPARRSCDFVEALFGASRRVHYSYADEGYIAILPPDAPLRPAQLVRPSGSNERRTTSVKECGKAVARRIHEPNFANRYFVGDGIDIGGAPDPLHLYASFFPRLRHVDVWDLPQGDAQAMAGVADATYDFVHSSHCLEHLHDPAEALSNWFRILRPGGHLIGLVPDEDLYEQGIWPSTFNGDHKWSFTIRKEGSWSPVSRNLVDLLTGLGAAAEIKEIRKLDAKNRDDLPRFDQTITPMAESAIEFVVRRRPTEELNAGGRLPPPGEVSSDMYELLTGISPAGPPAAAETSTPKQLAVSTGKATGFEVSEESHSEQTSETERLRAELNAVRRSYSWRITQPLRTARRLLRRRRS